MRRDIDLGRRNLLRIGALMAARALAPGAVLSPSYGQEAAAVDHTIRIAPVSLEIGPNTVIKTTGYNGLVPGPVLRLKEGRPVRATSTEARTLANSAFCWSSLQRATPALMTARSCLRRITGSANG
jgi:FtsP/CotA-like multicopper oxidase with cupredoxin domain